jgi:hypothetical protein
VSPSDPSFRTKPQMTPNLAVLRLVFAHKATDDEPRLRVLCGEKINSESKFVAFRIVRPNMADAPSSGVLR